MSNVLYIIGNGFEAAHGNQTGYHDFMRFLLNDYRMCLQNDNISDNIHPNLLYEVLASIETIGTDWKNFESALADFEICKLHELAAKAKPEIDDVRDRFTCFTEDIFSSLQDAFEYWVNSIKLNNKKKYVIKPNSEFLTFNYTHTLEVVYGIKREKIYHIHSEVCDPDKVHHKYVIGHGCHDEEISRRISKIDDDCKYEFRDFLRCLKKDCQQQIQSVDFQNLLRRVKDVDNVIIIGHGLAKVDEPYFRELLRATPNALWWRCLHVESEDARIRTHELDKRIECVVSNDGNILKTEIK